MSIVNWCKSTLLCALLAFSLSSPLNALSEDEALLLRKDFQLYQAWSLSRNYFFGTSYPLDKVKALAWQMVYVTLLPAKYPQKTNMLTFYSKNLSSGKIKQAEQLAQKYIETYHLGLPFSEEQLAQAYVLRDVDNHWETLNVQHAPTAIASNFKQWIRWIASHGNTQQAIELDQRALRLANAKRFPIVFGQLIVKGIASSEMVSSNISIDEQGFFVAQAPTETLEFSLPGYQTVRLKLTNQQIQPLGSIVLQRLPHNTQTGMVGRVLPWGGLEQGNMVLQMQQLNTPHDPWQNVLVPLTITNTGQFYATDLVAGSYQLFINTAGKSRVARFAVKKGEIRGLSIIDLRPR